MITISMYQKVYLGFLIIAAILVVVSLIKTIKPATKGVQTERGQTLIEMTDSGFRPQNIEIVAGDIVIFKNVGNANRWPASNIHPSHQIYPEFDPLQAIRPGENWSFTFTKPGTWRYHDHLATELTGTVKVNAKTKQQTLSQQSKLPLPQVSPAIETELDKVNLVQAARHDADIEYWLKLVGPAKVMAELLKDSGGGATLDCHQEAHAIGKISYRLFGAVAFQKGDAACHSGFYHGAMETFLVEQGTENLAQDISQLCDGFETRFGKFECLHGVGHGVLAYLDYDLPKALQTCDQLKTEATDYNSISCQSGAFMENVVSAQGFGANRDHKTSWASSDPHFPCNAVDQSYSVQYQCYQMQTSWMLTLNGYDFDKVAQECLRARADMVSVCFKSYGRDAAGHTLRNNQKIVELCGKIAKNEDYHSQCVIGALNVIVDFWGAQIEDKPAQLCQLLPEPGKKICYGTLTLRLQDLFNDPAQRRKICPTFEQSYRNLCESRV